MKVTLPITQALHAASSFNGNSGLLKRQPSQRPLNEPAHAGIRPWDHHPSEVRGSLENWYHSTTFSIGTPPQSFNAILDLGSSSLVVPSIHNPQSNRTSKPLYNSSASSTFVPNGTLVSDNPFFFRNNSGFLSQDDFHIAGVTIKNHVFTEATAVDFGDCSFCNPYDTVLPLGPYNISSLSNFRSPIAHLVEQDLLDENIFSLRLSRGITDTQGQLVLGGVVDEELYEGTFTTIPVTDDIPDDWNVPGIPHEPPDFSEENWKVHAESLTLGNGSDIKQDFTAPTIAALDTAYYWIALSRDLAHSLNELMDAETWGPFAWVDCSRRSEFLDVTIVLEGQKFVLSPYDYILEQEYEDEPGKLYCLSAFVSAFLEDSGMVLLGHAFLRAFVTVFDLEGRTVSFATAKHSDNAGR